MSENEKRESAEQVENAVVETDENLTSEASSEISETPETPETKANTEKRKPKAAPPISKQRILSIGPELKANTGNKKRQEALFELTQSKKTGKILTGIVKGVEKIGAKGPAVAVLYKEDFKIIIPCSDMIDVKPVDTGDQLKYDQYALSKRLSSEIDYVILDIDEKNNIAVASRKRAMDRISREFYAGKTPQVVVDGLVEARIVCSNRAGIIVDVFGIEAIIPAKELSYQRVQDATTIFPVGETIVVKITDITIDENHKISIAASAKQAMENPYIKAFERYKVGYKYVGEVSMVDKNGVFVALDGGIDVLCPFPPKGGRPTRGNRATIKITSTNEDPFRIYGLITYVAL